jgi:hypothetical protein
MFFTSIHLQQKKQKLLLSTTAVVSYHTDSSKRYLGTKIAFDQKLFNTVSWSSKVKLQPVYYTRRFIMFSLITNIYNKKTKGPTLMELPQPQENWKSLFWQLEIFDVCTAGDTAHIDTIFKFLPHTRQHGWIAILHCYNDPCLKASTFMRVWYELEYCIDVRLNTRSAHIARL